LIEADNAAAPAFLPVEVANGLRSAAFSGLVSEENATSAHEEFLSLAIELYDYAPRAARVWELRHNVTPYDAWYVALAEDLLAPLVTLDGPLLRAPGPRCEFLTYHA
jgi:predicted nucleic acid-binding protein